MASNQHQSEMSHRPDWGWKIGFVLDSPELLADLTGAIAEAGAAPLFRLPASTAPFDIVKAVERDKADILFVELAGTAKAPAEWMADVRRGDELPFVIAVHPAADPVQMISALRAGASEFLSLPVRPAIFEALDRIGADIESRRTSLVEPGKIAGFLSPRGGCGATSVACHLSAALQLASPTTRTLVADLDYQSPAAAYVFRASGSPGSDRQRSSREAFEAVRRLNSGSWRDFVTPVAPGVDLLASPAEGISGNFEIPIPEQWRVETLFRFVSRQYNWVLADLGRHLTPANWSVVQNIHELFLVTAPDVLALYQTRTILQTLSSRGFDRSRIRIILNRNMNTPQSFWVESIQQMFEMSVFGVIPSDDLGLEKLPRDRFEFPAETPFGKAVTKIAGRIVKPAGPPGAMAKKAA